MRSIHSAAALMMPIAVGLAAVLSTAAAPQQEAVAKIHIMTSDDVKDASNDVRMQALTMDSEASLTQRMAVVDAGELPSDLAVRDLSPGDAMSIARQQLTPGTLRDADYLRIVSYDGATSGVVVLSSTKTAWGRDYEVVQIEDDGETSSETFSLSRATALRGPCSGVCDNVTLVQTLIYGNVCNIVPLCSSVVDAIFDDINNDCHDLREDCNDATGGPSRTPFVDVVCDDFGNCDVTALYRSDLTPGGQTTGAFLALQLHDTEVSGYWLELTTSNWNYQLIEAPGDGTYFALATTRVRYPYPNERARCSRWATADVVVFFQDGSNGEGTYAGETRDPRGDGYTNYMVSCSPL